MKKISLDIIGIVGVPARYGGFETLVERLLQDKDFSKTFSTRVLSTNKYRKNVNIFRDEEIILLTFKVQWYSKHYVIALSIFISIFSKSRRYNT